MFAKERSDNDPGGNRLPFGGLQQALGRSRSPCGMSGDGTAVSPFPALPIIHEGGSAHQSPGHAHLLADHVLGPLPQSAMAPSPAQLQLPQQWPAQQPGLPEGAFLTVPMTLSPSVESQKSIQSQGSSLHVPALPTSIQHAGVHQHQLQLQQHQPQQAGSQVGLQASGSGVFINVGSSACEPVHSVVEGIPGVWPAPPSGLSGIAPVRGGLSKAVAAASPGQPSPPAARSLAATLPAGSASAAIADGGRDRSYGMPTASPHGHVGTVLAAPPAVTPLSSSFGASLGQEGLPSWLQQRDVQQGKEGHGHAREPVGHHHHRDSQPAAAHHTHHYRQGAGATSSGPGPAAATPGFNRDDVTAHGGRIFPSGQLHWSGPATAMAMEGSTQQGPLPGQRYFLGHGQSQPEGQLVPRGQLPPPAHVVSGQQGLVPHSTTGHGHPHPPLSRKSPFLPPAQPSRPPQQPPHTSEAQLLGMRTSDVGRGVGGGSAGAEPSGIPSGPLPYGQMLPSNADGAGRDDGFGAASDSVSQAASSRGRSNMPRVASISEIEPMDESEEPRLRQSSSLLTRAISIPRSQGGERPRTYRVAPAKNPGSQDDVTVVLEGCDDGDRGDRSVRGGTRGGGGSTHGSHYSYGSSGGGGGTILGGSVLNPSFLGGFFGGRSVVAGSMPYRGGVLTPDNSVHGSDSLPFSGRDRYFYGGGSELPAPAFGSLPNSSSLLRARAMNTSVGSVLNKATGGLKQSAMKKSTSYQQFSSAAMTQGSVHAGAASSGRAGGGRSTVAGTRSGIAGGSDSSGAGTSASASVGGTGGGGGSGSVGLWMRGGSIPRGGSGEGMSAGAAGVGLDGEGALARVSRRGAEPDLADLMLLATSLPASLGTWSLPRSVALASSPHNVGGGSAWGASAGGVLGRSLSRANSTASMASGITAATGGGGGGAAGPSTAGPTGATVAAAAGPPPYPICLICLEVLTPEDFERGDALSLQCACKGEVSLRHRNCAIEWSHHKGDVICDICKQGIANLPPIPAEVLAAREAARRRRQPNFNTAAEPNFADYVFDCIRATWVTMIVCVLFFDLSIGQAFMAGAVAGVAFAFISAVIAACARRARAQAAARAVEQAAAESRAEEQRRRQQSQSQQGGSVGGAQGVSGSGLMQPLLSSAADAV